MPLISYIQCMERYYLLGLSWIYIFLVGPEVPDSSNLSDRKVYCH